MKCSEKGMDFYLPVCKLKIIMYICLRNLFFDQSMKKFILILFICFSCEMVFSEKQVFFQHYSVENGLSQNTVTSIIQDSKGFIWFGTWDGLNKFDGYEFTIYKSQPGDYSNIATNRIDFIYEDKLGFLWIQTYDGRIHRFDPRIEQFYSLPYKTNRFEYGVEREKRFIETSKGEIWIATNKIGAIRVISDPKTLKLSTINYSTLSEENINDNHINFIKEDSEKNIWLGTNNGLCCVEPNSDQIKSYQLNEKQFSNAFYCCMETHGQLWFGDSNGNVWNFSSKKNRFTKTNLSTNSIVTDIAAIDNQHIVATTDNEGFYILDASSKIISHFNKNNSSQITDNNFKSVKVDSEGIAWFESEQSGIFRYRLTDNSLKHFQPKVDDVNPISILPNFMIFEDIYHQLWINPQGGGFSRYNREKDELEYFYNEPRSPHQLFTNVIHAAYADRNGNLWLSTYNKGIEKISFYTPQFHLRKVNKNISSLTANEVRAFLQTSDNYIIIATKDGSIHFFDEKLNELGILSQNGQLNSGNKINDMAYCMFEDSKKNIWIGTKGGGVLKLIPRDSNNKIPSYQIQRFENNPLDNNSLSNNNIYSIIEDKNGHILIGTFGGGLNILTEGKEGVSFINFKNKLKNYPISTCPKIRHLLLDKNNTLWVATSNGLLQIDDFLTSKMKIYHIEKLPNMSASLSNNDVQYLHSDKKGQLWIATFGGGLLKLKDKATDHSPATFVNYSNKEGIYNDIILSIQEDEQGNLWLSSENSISRFEPSTHYFQNYQILNGINDVFFSEAASLFTRKGEMLFGCNKGFYYFIPRQIKKSEEIPPIEFTRLQLFNQDVKIGEKNSPLKQSITYSNIIELTHKQSVFSIEYAALDYVNPEKIQYAFKLENFDKDWNYVQNQRKATYTNLPKGTYYFRVKSTNNEGAMVNNEKMITIKILPSFWETSVAYVLYGIVFLLLLYTVYYLTSIYLKLKNEVIIEQKVSEIKLRFFTNISHELRTPLTLIIGPIENILKNEKLSTTAHEQLKIVYNNTNRMMRLINQILDFRKVQNNKMRLKVQPIYLVPFLQNICSNFKEEAQEKNMDFKFVNNVGDVVLWLDMEKVDIIFYNLLSNAFKFTPNNKKIEVRIEQSNNNEDIQIKVIDEGIGIPKEKKPFLYERFTSHNEINTLSNLYGSGIGLNLVKEFVDLHKGTIEVESEPGEGSTFTVVFHKGKDHFGDEVDILEEKSNVLLPVDESLIDQNDAKISIEELESYYSTASKEAPFILVIEDDKDMRHFLKMILSKNYHVESAIDGVDGWGKILSLFPDLVISDLMMPNKDGLELIQLIKDNEKTSHIPVILLTEKNAVESKLQAYQYGADDYITKPFSPILLEARVENLLQQRKKLQENYRKRLFDLEPSTVKTSSHNEIFLTKLLEVMEKNMDNDNFTVEDLVSEMGYGRTVFFNKLKGLTGLSPIEFIKELRIKRAAQFLRTGEYTVSEVTYMVGMNDARYFSKCFKKIYGETPSEYKKRYETENKSSE